MKERIKTKQEINNIINKKIQHSLLQLRQHHYDFGDKTRKLLSNQLKIQKERSNITAILDNTSTMAQDSTTINEIFTSFCSALYSLTNIYQH